jgi:hypothetical protein
MVYGRIFFTLAHGTSVLIGKINTTCIQQILDYNINNIEA